MKLKYQILSICLIALVSVSPVFAAFVNTCTTNNDAFFSATPLDSLAGSSNYDGLNGGLYGPQTSTGSNDMTVITGGTQHLTDGQNIAKGTGVTGGPSGVTALCIDGTAPPCAGGNGPSTIGVAIVGMSSDNRLWCSANAQNPTTEPAVGTFLSQCLNDSFLLAVQSANISQRFDNSGSLAFQSLNFANNLTWINGGQEAQGLNQWAVSNGNCNLTAADPACDLSTVTSPWKVLKNIRTPNFAINTSGSVGVDPRQVQVVFLLDTYQSPGTLATFGALNAACTTSNVTGGGGTEIVGCDMARYIAVMIRELKQHVYTNLQMVFVNSLYYEGYATASISPPPCGYENGFAVKEAIQAQISQDNDANHAVQDNVTGDLCYETGRHSCPSGVTAPWVGWGPYIWANGITNANAYGVTYVKGVQGGTGSIKDYNSADFTHPSQYGNLNTQSTSAPIGVSKYVYQMFHWLNDNATTTSGGNTVTGGTGLTCWALGNCAVSPTPTPTATPTTGPSPNGTPLGSLCN